MHYEFFKNKMAESNNKYIVNDLLCYFRCKLGKLPANAIKRNIIEFYSADDVFKAKQALYDESETLTLTETITESVPKNVRRNKSQNKTQLEVDDIETIFSFYDRNQLFATTPQFVSSDINNLPPNRCEEGEFRIILNRMERMEDKLLQASSRPSWAERVSGQVAGAGVTTLKPQPQLALSKSTLSQSSIQSAFATSRFSPSAPVNREATELKTFIDGPSSEGQWEIKTSKKPKPKLKSFKGTNGTKTVIKAAKPLIKKNVFFIGNLDEGTKPDEMINYIKDIGIVPLGVFEAKTRHDGCTAFRVTIKSSDSELFCDPNNWAEHVLVRQWIFKQSNGSE